LLTRFIDEPCQPLIQADRVLLAFAPFGDAGEKNLARPLIQAGQGFFYAPAR